jgi:phosphoglucosamine mutase
MDEEHLTSKLFGSSGVRGLANEELTPSLAAEIAGAVVICSNAKKVLLGRDTRTSGPMLEAATVAGLLSVGANVWQLGIVPTPVLAFLTRKLKADAGIMITASHNPPQYNGLKIFNADGMAYDMKAQGKVEETIGKRQLKTAHWADVGRSEQRDESRLYAETVCRKVKLRRKWYVVVDPGCGATYSLAPQILKNLGCEIATLNAQADGHFPARSPEPNAESLRPLAKIVKDFGADVGVAFDGDGDRAAFIDEKGSLADFDRTLAVYAAHVVKRKAAAIVVTNVEASMSVEKMVEQHHGTVIRTKVGDIYVSEEMKKHKAVFGGEPCGAWIHPQLHYCPDGILTSALLLKALEEEGTELSEFVAQAPVYPMVRKNIACKNTEKDKVMRQLGESLNAAFPDRREASNIDGVRIVLERGWMLVRASGTEPLIRLTVEAESLRTANKIMEKSAILVRKLVKEEAE